MAEINFKPHTANELQALISNKTFNQQLTVKDKPVLARAGKAGEEVITLVDGGELVETKNSVKKDGDMVVTNMIDGKENSYVVTAEKFAKLYAPVEGKEGEYKQISGIKEVFITDRAILIVPPWGGEMKLRAGAALVQEGDKFYGINPAEFAATHTNVYFSNEEQYKKLQETSSPIFTTDRDIGINLPWGESLAMKAGTNLLANGDSSYAINAADFRDMLSQNKDVYMFARNDAEAERIKTVLEAVGAHFVDKQISWGASTDHFKNDIESAIALDKRVITIELINKLEPSTRDKVTEIDHHGPRYGEPASIIQVLNVLGKEPTREDLLIAANDSGHIKGMQAMGATLDEMQEIRARDRAAQGITPEIEKSVDAALSKPAEYLAGSQVRLIESEFSKTSPIMDRLAFEDIANNRPVKDTALILAKDGEINFYGPRQLVNELNEKFKGGWSGGGENHGFWGGYADQKEVKAFVESYIERQKPVIVLGGGDPEMVAVNKLMTAEHGAESIVQALMIDPARGREIAGGLNAYFTSKGLDLKADPGQMSALLNKSPGDLIEVTNKKTGESITVMLESKQLEGRKLSFEVRVEDGSGWKLASKETGKSDLVPAFGDGAYNPVAFENSEKALVSIPLDRKLVTVEASVPGMNAVKLDHHKTGDPGFDKGASEYLSASSIGQAYKLALESKGVTVKSENDLAKGIASVYGEKTLTEVRFLAAADHCLPAAYASKCEGVNPEALLESRLAQQAIFKKTTPQALLEDVRAFETLMKDKPLETLQGADGKSYKVAVFDGPLPGSPEAAAYFMGKLSAAMDKNPDYAGLVAVIARDPQIPNKIVLQSDISKAGGATSAFIALAQASEPVETYGAPSRGFAGTKLTSPEAQAPGKGPLAELKARAGLTMANPVEAKIEKNAEPLSKETPAALGEKIPAATQNEKGFDQQAQKLEQSINKTLESKGHPELKIDVESVRKMLREEPGATLVAVHSATGEKIPVNLDRATLQGMLNGEKIKANMEFLQGNEQKKLAREESKMEPNQMERGRSGF